jgi:hypothetical protein
MSFLTLKGALATNPHLPAHGDSYLLLTCSTVADTLVLFDFANNQTPYQGYNTGHDNADGRSLAGAIRIKGLNYPVKKRLELAFLVSDAMVAAFEAILGAQRQNQAITVVDNWDLQAISRIMWVDVADRYRTKIAANRHLLQFSAWEQ